MGVAGQPGSHRGAKVAWVGTTMLQTVGARGHTSARTIIGNKETPAVTCMAQFPVHHHAEGSRRSPQAPSGHPQPQEPQWDPHALKGENENEVLQVMNQAMYGDAMVDLDNSSIMLTEADIDTAPAATGQDKAFQLYPAVLQLHPEVLQLYPAVLQLHPEVFQLYPAVLQLHPEVLQLCPAALQLQPDLPLQLHPAALQPAPLHLPSSLDTVLDSHKGATRPA